MRRPRPRPDPRRHRRSAGAPQPPHPATRPRSPGRTATWCGAAAPAGIDAAALQAASDWAFDRDNPEQVTLVCSWCTRPDRPRAVAPGVDMTTRTRTWSTAKSIAATLIGMLVDQGRLETRRAAWLRLAPAARGAEPIRARDHPATRPQHGERSVTAGQPRAGVRDRLGAVLLGGLQLGDGALSRGSSASRAPTGTTRTTTRSWGSTR